MKIMGFSTEIFPNKPICWRVASAVVSARFILEVVLLETWIRGDGKLRAKPSGTGKIHPNFRKQWRFIAWNICIFLVCWKCLGQTARIEHGKGFSALDDILQYLVGGLEHDFYEFPYIGNNIPNWRAHIFQRGRYSTNQICSNLVLCIVSYGHNLKPRLSWRSSSWSRIHIRGRWSSLNLVGLYGNGTFSLRRTAVMSWGPLKKNHWKRWPEGVAWSIHVMFMYVDTQFEYIYIICCTYMYVNH